MCPDNEEGVYNQDAQHKTVKRFKMTMHGKMDVLILIYSVDVVFIVAQWKINHMRNLFAGRVPFCF